MSKYAAYDVLVFDLGNTILPIAPNLTVQSFRQLGLKGDILMPNGELKSLMDNYQRGKITTDSFIRRLQCELPVATTEEQIIKAWNAMLLEFPLVNLSLLETLAETHELILLSNTNSLHAACFEQKAERFGKSFHSYFDAVYYSHELGISKPDAAIYRHVDSAHVLQGKKVLFLDDLAENLVEPQRLGWDVCQVSLSHTIRDFA